MCIITGTWIKDLVGGGGAPGSDKRPPTLSNCFQCYLTSPFSTRLRKYGKNICVSLKMVRPNHPIHPWTRPTVPNVFMHVLYAL